MILSDMLPGTVLPRFCHTVQMDIMKQSTQCIWTARIKIRTDPGQA